MGDKSMNIIMLIGGLAFVLFIPGFLLTFVLFKRLEAVERVMLAFCLSMAIDVILGFFLGANESLKNLTGGITGLGVWLYLTLISLLFLITAIVTR